MSLNYEIFTKMVKQISQSVSRNFPPYVTAEDTAGHLWVWIYEKRSSILQTVEDGPDWEPKIASTMRKVAFDYCAREKAAAEGYSTEDLYRYTIPKIKSLVPDAFSHTDWQSFGAHGDGQPTGRPLANRTGDRLAELVDVKSALKALPSETKELLFLIHQMQYTSENLAEHFGINNEAAKKRSVRAYGALQKKLGKKDPGEQPRRSDRRTVRSNAAWRAAQSNSYEGE